MQNKVSFFLLWPHVRWCKAGVDGLGWRGRGGQRGLGEDQPKARELCGSQQLLPVFQAHGLGASQSGHTQFHCFSGKGLELSWQKA